MAARTDEPFARGWRIVAVAGTGALTICAVSAVMPGDFAERLGRATRLTARWSALWFLITFTAGPLVAVIGPRWMPVLKLRRSIGLGFAVAHLVHASCFIWLILATPVTRSWLAIVGGGIGYAFVVAMAATANDVAMRGMGGRWRRVHGIGMWWIWLVFVTSYAGRIFRPGTEALGLTMTTAFMLAAALRLPAVRLVTTSYRRRLEGAR